MLDNALDLGISEFDFWNMTLGELDRATKSKIRVQKAQQQEVALHNYILGDLIGRSNARLHSNSAKFPKIYEVYPSLFDAEEFEERQQQRIMEESAERFKQFAESFNKKLRKKEGKEIADE
jgi:hypothetical protein